MLPQKFTHFKKADLAARITPLCRSRVTPTPYKEITWDVYNTIQGNALIRVDVDNTIQGNALIRVDVNSTWKGEGGGRPSERYNTYR